jgi:1-acyl-sn-glycerol-3-phosphate acyltransferase
MSTTIDQAKQEEQGEEPAQSAGPKKPARNLYQPYSTPRIAWDFVRFCVYIISIFTTRIHLRGRYNLPRKGPYIIAANHLSWLDIPLIPTFVPGKVIFMAKEEAFHSKIGWLIRFLGAFPVKRGEGDRQAIRAADEQLKQQKVFMIFPEGTRSKTHTLGKGHAGVSMIALRGGVPVIPVAIWGSENGLKKFAAPITIAFGEPLILRPRGTKITRGDIQAGTDEIMCRIAAMLPASYRGVYAEQVENLSS